MSGVQKCKKGSTLPWIEKTGIVIHKWFINSSFYIHSEHWSVSAMHNMSNMYGESVVEEINT